MADWQSNYNSLFVSAVNRILKHEGFFSDDPSDPGGPTKYGISLRYLRSTGSLGDFDGDGDVDRDDIWALTEADAVKIYHDEWYVKEGYACFELLLGAKIFDLAVNMGARPANRILQRAVRAVNGKQLTLDGKLGPKSLAAVTACSSEQLLIASRSEAAGYYRLLIEREESFEKYRNGWLNRAYA